VVVVVVVFLVHAAVNWICLIHALVNVILYQTFEYSSIAVVCENVILYSSCCLTHLTELVGLASEC